LINSRARIWVDHCLLGARDGAGEERGTTGAVVGPLLAGARRVLFHSYFAAGRTRGRARRGEGGWRRKGDNGRTGLAHTPPRAFGGRWQRRDGSGGTGAGGELIAYKAGDETTYTRAPTQTYT